MIIPFHWLCAAPIWVLPGYFDLLLTMCTTSCVLSSTVLYQRNFIRPFRKENSEIDSEDKVKAWATAHKIDWIILRPTLIYGYGRDKNISEIAQVIRRFGFFPLFGPAQGLRQPIHVEDVALACCRALDTLNLANRSIILPVGKLNVP